MSLMVDIIHAINRYGRQGPRDLKSPEVFDWVRRGVDISYAEYCALLLRNSIADRERGARRDAYFTVDPKGQYSLFKSREAELRPYVCAVIAREPGLTSDRIIRRVKLLYQAVTPVDLMLQQNIASPQEIIDQTIRNILVSNFDRQANSELFERSGSTPYVYRLTEKGAILAAAGEALAAGSEDGRAARFAEERAAKPYSERELAALAARQASGPPDAVAGRGRVYFAADPRLKATRKALAGYKCEADILHWSFITPTGEPYVEGHHIIPMAAQKCCPQVHLDCLENLISLCPNCHRAVHYGHPALKAKIIEKALAARGADFAKLGFSAAALAELVEVYYGR